jgi:DNA-binding CsgD family transcriptional regulator
LHKWRPAAVGCSRAHAPVTLLVAINPEADSRVSAEGLAAFGLLSAAELDVCRHLVRGLSLADLAARRDTGLETLRSQSKAVQAKLACRGRLDIDRSGNPAAHRHRHPPQGDATD